MPSSKSINVAASSPKNIIRAPSRPKKQLSKENKPAMKDNTGNKPLTVGNRVWYKGNPKGSEIANIVAVHRNDPNNTYYTISINGKERQTERRKLDPMESKPNWTFFTNDGRNFKEYEYTADELPEFVAFAIKIVGQSNNTCVVPLVSALRCIALT